MQFSYKAVIAAVAIFTQGVMSFGDASPHIFFSSTEEINGGLNDGSRLSGKDSAEFNRVVGTALSDCPADAYIFVHQPALHIYDLTGSSFSNLGELYDSATSKYTFPYLFSKQNVGNDVSSIPSDSFDSLAQEIHEKCNAELVQVDTTETNFKGYIDTTPRVIVLDFPTLPNMKDRSARADALKHLDDTLLNVVRKLPSPNYVVIMTSSPVSDSAPPQSNPVIANSYNENFKKHAEELDADVGVEEAEEEEPQLDPSKVISESPVVSATSTVVPTGLSDEELFVDTDGLFERYQFFTAGIFEVIIVSFLLLFFLFTGLGWLSSLQITYKAFEKAPETPGASKAQ